MKSNATSQQRCYDPFEVIDLRDRFQGALLGLQLVPIALREPSASQSPLMLSARSQLQQAIEYTMAQTHAFVSAPNTWTVDIVRLPDPAFLLPASVPFLLRYHHNWQRRLDWLKSIESQMEGLDTSLDIHHAPENRALEPFQQRLAQVVLLGDLLEVIGTGLRSTSWIPWLMTRAAEYRRECFLSVQYEAVLLAIGGDRPFERLEDHETHRHFAIGVSSTMTHLESYSLAISCLAREALMFGLEADARPVKNAADAWMAAFIAGLLSGMAGGKSVLPVSWRLHLSADSEAADGADLAGDLFKLWSGQRL